LDFFWFSFFSLVSLNDDSDNKERGNAKVLRIFSYVLTDNETKAQTCFHHLKQKYLQGKE
jgi:hypothetical protein